MYADGFEPAMHNSYTIEPNYNNPELDPGRGPVPPPPPPHPPNPENQFYNRVKFLNSKSKGIYSCIRNALVLTAMATKSVIFHA